MKTGKKLVDCFRMPGLTGICSCAIVYILQTVTAGCLASDNTVSGNSVAGTETTSALPASAEGSPPAPELPRGQDSRYVKQAGLLDTSAPSSGLPAAPPKKAAVPKNDLELVNSLAVPGWEGLAPLRLLRSGNTLAGPDGKAVEEIEGKLSSALIEYGCTEAVSRRFRRGQRYGQVALFRFAGAEGAYGAYTTLRNGSSTVIVRGQGSSEDDESITFFSGNALVFLRCSQDDDEAKGMLGRLADQIAPYFSRAPVAVPRLISNLPRLDRLAGSEKFFMGFQSANRYCNTPFLDVLLLEQSRGAAAADYLYPRPRPERLKLFVAEYGNQSLAQNAFNSYAAAMGSYCRKTLDKTDSQILCKMADSYLMSGTSGNRVWIISGAKRASAPATLVGELTTR